MVISPDFGKTAQEELAEAAGMFHLTEHGFDNVLSFGVTRAALGGPQFVSHPLLHRRAFRRRAGDGFRRRLVMLLATNGNVGVEAFRFYRVLGEVAGVHLFNSAMIWSRMIMHAKKTTKTEWMDWGIWDAFFLDRLLAFALASLMRII